MLKYNLYGIYNLIQEGYTSKVQKIEKALAKLNEGLKPFSVADHHVFVVNETTGDVFRSRYTIEENVVSFFEPQRIEIQDDRKDFQLKEEKLVEGIVDALSEGQDEEVTRLKRQYFNLSRDMIRLDNLLESDMTRNPIEIQNARKAVGKVVAENKQLQVLVANLPQNELITKFMNEGMVNVDLDADLNYVKEISEETYVRNSILEARQSARKLYENEEFCTDVKNIVIMEDEHYPYLALVEGDTQEFFTLKSSEMVTVIERVYNRAGMDVSEDRVREVVTNLVELAERVIPKQMNRLYEYVGEHGVDYDKNLRLVEAEMNRNVYSLTDVESIMGALGLIVGESNDVLSPEIVHEFRKAYETLGAMRNTGIVDDRSVMNVINLVSQYSPAPAVSEEVGVNYNAPRIAKPVAQKNNSARAAMRASFKEKCEDENCELEHDETGKCNSGEMKGKDGIKDEIPPEANDLPTGKSKPAAPPQGPKTPSTGGTTSKYGAFPDSMTRRQARIGLKGKEKGGEADEGGDEGAE